MKQVLVHHSSIRFARAAYGAMALIAFSTGNMWIVLTTAILMGVSVISADKYNFFLQLHKQVLRHLLKDTSKPILWDIWELRFACGLGTSFLLTAFFLIYFEKAINIAWILVLTLSFFMLLAGFSGICAVTIVYVALKKILVKKINPSNN